MVGFGLYLFMINLLGLILMGYDKQQAIKGNWRIAEAHFFIIALVGGPIGILLGMRLFRHKTKHLSFTMGMPAILFLNIFLGIAIVHYLS